MPDDVRIRTSLSRAPSDLNPAEHAANMADLERLLWMKYEAIIVRMSDPGMATIVEAIGITRFGKRSTTTERGT